MLAIKKLVALRGRRKTVFRLNKDGSMGFFQRLSKFFTSPAPQGDSLYWFYVQCNRCGEKIRGKVDFRNEVSPEYGEGDKTVGFFCRKVLLGEQHCFQQIEVTLKFDTRHKLKERQISGGDFISEEEYKSANPAS